MPELSPMSLLIPEAYRRSLCLIDQNPAKIKIYGLSGWLWKRQKNSFSCCRLGWNFNSRVITVYAAGQADEVAAAQVVATFSAEYSRFLTESLLLTLEQIDMLDQMLDDALHPATQLLEHNRTLRAMLRTTMTEATSAMNPLTQLCAVRFLGQQQKLLLTIKGIRGRGIGDG